VAGAKVRVVVADVVEDIFKRVADRNLVVQAVLHHRVREGLIAVALDTVVAFHVVEAARRDDVLLGDHQNKRSTMSSGKSARRREYRMVCGSPLMKTVLKDSPGYLRFLGERETITNFSALLIALRSE
jgi:hypothetical protein